MTERLNNTSKEKLYTLRRYENSSFQPEFEANRTRGRAQGIYLLVFFFEIYLFLAVLGLCYCVGFSLAAARLRTAAEHEPWGDRPQELPGAGSGELAQ